MKPIAWMRLTGNRVTRITLEKVQNNDVPLYTHPIKELTDEEITETVKDHFIGAIKIGIILTNDNVLDFARAILKKAQE